MPRPLALAVGLCGLGLTFSFTHAATPEPPALFLDYIRAEASALHASDPAPASLEEWQQQRTTLRSHLLQAWGGFPDTPCALEPRKHGELQRDGYRVEKIVFQTLPGVWMTANAYVPRRPGKLPAVLAVHGHWPGAKQDPVVQARCIGLAKLGFFVLAVDAFGAGERAVGKALGEYHGDMTAATLLPVGLPLSGIQVYENMRAADYLRTRPEVDGTKIGITGASGGGNQTMYAGAWDDRFAAVVPVCSVGNYHAFLGAGCCMCEVVPGALRFTEEWTVLASVAPRPLLVINATQDSVQFSVAEARKSLTLAQSVFDLSGKTDFLRHRTFESPHAYNQPMREAMYGWMGEYLRGAGSGEPIAEPEMKLEDPETLRCFPGTSRPDDYVTLPRFAANEAKKLLARISPPTDHEQVRAWRANLREHLARSVRGGEGTAPAAMERESVSRVDDDSGRTITFRPERLIELRARQEPAGQKPAKLALLLDLDGAEQARKHEIAGALRRSGWTIVTLDLRATGQLAVAKARVGRAPDHNPAEWALWIGRPLLGQWIIDVQRALDAIEITEGALPRELAIVGTGPAGLVAMVAAALDPRITRAAAVGSLASYVTDVPFEKQWLGLMVPGVLRDVGDIPQIAAAIAPRPLIVAGSINGSGRELTHEALTQNYTFTRNVFAKENADSAFILLSGTQPDEVARRLN